MRRISLMFLYLSILLLAAGCSSDKAVESKSVFPDDIPDFVQESDLKQINWDQKAVEFGSYGGIGNENKSGVSGADMPSLDDQKWMWHLWGKEYSNAELTVVGFHKESETVHQILKRGWTIDLGGPNNGADAHTPSMVKIPKSGDWAMLLYADGKLVDTLVYEINR